jgi:PhnB protein
VRFYEKVLGGEATIMHFSDAPPNPAFPVPDNLKNLVLHAELRKDGNVIHFSDWFTPNVPYSSGNNISFALQFNTKEENKAMFNALSVGGTIELELQETFFSPLSGKFTDKFGVMWQIVCNKA